MLVTLQTTGRGKKKRSRVQARFDRLRKQIERH